LSSASIYSTESAQAQGLREGTKRWAVGCIGGALLAALLFGLSRIHPSAAANLAIEEMLDHVQKLPLLALALLILANALVVARGIPALLGSGPNIALGWLARRFLALFAHVLAVSFGGLAAVETFGLLSASIARPSWITLATWAIAGSTSWSASVTLVLARRGSLAETKRERFLAFMAVLFAVAVVYVVLFS
jgi:hypothetical protein